MSKLLMPFQSQAPENAHLVYPEIPGVHAPRFLQPPGVCGTCELSSEAEDMKYLSVHQRYEGFGHALVLAYCPTCWRKMHPYHDHPWAKK